MVTLPDRIHEYNRIPTALMGWKGMGEQVMPFTQEVEEAQIMTMRDELEVNFGVTVTRNFDLRRTVDMGEVADYVLIGGSNGGNLGEVIDRKGRKVINLTEKGMRVTVETVGRLESKLSTEGQDRVTIKDDMVVVIMVMDNSLYFVEEEDGGRHLPQRSEDGKYHIDGQLKLATGRQAAKVMEKFLPILRRLKKNRKLIVVPSPRYVCKACCSDKNHCTNRGEEGFLSGMLSGIKEIRRVIRDSCHEWRVSNYKVVNICTMLDLQEESDYSAWEGAMGEDPVHLTSQAYGKLADCIFQMAEGRDAVFSGGKRDLEEEDDRPAPTILGRKAWVYGSNGRGGGRGGLGGQGGRGTPRGGRGVYRTGSHAGGYGFSPAGGSFGGYSRAGARGGYKR
jgi:hypothetical protein